MGTHYLMPVKLGIEYRDEKSVYYVDGQGI